MKKRESLLPYDVLTGMLDYDPHTGIFRWKVRSAKRIKVGDATGCITGNGHLTIIIFGKAFSAHRLAWFYVHKVWPLEHIDHINMIKTDNRIENLREASKYQNRQNLGKRVSNTSGYKGVWKASRGDKFEAGIGFDGKKIHLGTFATAEEAHDAYVEAAKTHHKSYRRDN